MGERVPDPATLEEYNAKFMQGSEVTGYGMDVTQHLPCPFCAHPGFKELQPVAGIVDDRPNIDAQMEAEATCENCGRSGRAVVTRDASGVSAEFVQTGGDDPPEYLPPMRRVEDS